MNKIWKVLGAAALVGLIPYSFYNKDKNGRVTTHALLWKSTVEPDPNTGKRKITIDIGFHNPLAKGEELLFEDQDYIDITPEPVAEDDDPMEQSPF